MKTTTVIVLLFAGVMSSLLAAGVLYVIASGAPGYELGGFATNGFGEFSPGGYAMTSALVAEVVLTAGPGKGYRGTIQQTPSKTGKVFSWTVRCPCTRENSPQQGKEMRLYPLGAWYLEDAMKGVLESNCL